MNCDCDCCPEIELTTQISPERITILLQRQPDAHRDESKVAANMKARQIYEKRRNARGTLRFPGSDFFLFPAGILDKKNAAQNEKKIAELVTRQKRRKIRRKFFLRYLNILKFNAIILICRFYVNVRARPLLSPRKNG